MSENFKSLVLQDKCIIEIFLSPAVRLSFCLSVCLLQANIALCRWNSLNRLSFEKVNLKKKADDSKHAELRWCIQLILLRVALSPDGWQSKTIILSTNVDKNH